MNIAFSIPDEIGATFISASRWRYPTRNDLTDNRICVKYLKYSIGTLIDEYDRYVAIGSLEQELDALRQESETKLQAKVEAERALDIARRDYNQSAVTTNLGD